MGKVSREKELLETVREVFRFCTTNPTKDLKKKMLWKLYGMESQRCWNLFKLAIIYLKACKNSFFRRAPLVSVSDYVLTY